MRLNKYIAENSEYSRRTADELIKRGKVFLNGKRVSAMGTKVTDENDQVAILKNGKIQTLKRLEEKYYFALHKPMGYVSTKSDEFGRPTVMDLMPKIKNLKPVGRLDKDTEGLLLLSNDGEFINHLTHPRYHCEKEYFAVLQGKLSFNNKAQLENGILLEGQLTAPCKIKILQGAAAAELAKQMPPAPTTPLPIATNQAKISKYQPSRNPLPTKHLYTFQPHTPHTNPDTYLTITLTEGRKRQIRLMFDSFTCPVKYLLRIRIGPLKLENLPKGQYKKIAKDIFYANQPH